MFRDFSAELRAVIKNIDNKVPVAPKQPRFNVHKRSLPVGLDKIVVFGVLKGEATSWIENRLKSKCYENDPDSSKTLIYYDVIPIDATPKERSIYHNPEIFLKSED